MLAALTHQLRDLELAEDVLQESIVVALEKWVDLGVPDNPPSWLMQTAKRKAIDRFRRGSNFADKVRQIQILEEIEMRSLENNPGDDDNYIPDERLRLIFTCCHPALSDRIRVALTLKTLCGLSTAQVANAFLVSETTMAQRLVRAKGKIKNAGIPYQVPPEHALPERLSAVLSVIYFIYNEGYRCTTGDQLISTELSEEAIRLATMMLRLMPGQTEVMGLLSLILFHHSRCDARIDQGGRLIDLENQDRASWNRSLIEDADKILKGGLMMGRPGPYQIQAAISAVHAHAETFAATDWKQIVMLYQKLEDMDTNPVIKLNLAVALSFAENPQIALSYLDLMPELQKLESYHPYYAARADMLRRLGRSAEAREIYGVAIELCGNQVEKQYLMDRVASMNGD